MDKGFVWVLVIIMSVCMLIGFGLGVVRMRCQAVQNGVAEWIVIDSYGKTKFQWKTK